MTKPIDIVEYAHILKQLGDPVNPLIDSVQVFMDSNNDLIAQIHDEKDPGEVQRFQLIDFDGFVTIPTGSQAIDLLLSHFFKSTPDQDATWTTTSIRQNHLVLLHVDNTAGKTITFGTGFTDVDAISDVGIQNKLLYYDGVTWREIAIGGGGLPAIIENQTYRGDSSNQVEATDNLLNDGSWEVWNNGSIHGGGKTISAFPFTMDTDYIEIELNGDLVVTIDDVKKKGQFIVFKFIENAIGNWQVDFSDDFIHNGKRAYSANETFTIAFISDGERYNEVPSFNISNAQTDKVVFYDSQRLLLYNTNGQEIGRLQSTGFEGFTYFPRFTVYDSVNSVGYSITTDNKLIKHTTSSVTWVVDGFNVDDPNYYNQPIGIKLGSDGYVYVATRVRIYVYDSDGVAVTNFGGYGIDTNGKFAWILDFQEYGGDLYILDQSGTGGTYQIQKWQNDGTYTWRYDTINGNAFTSFCLAIDATQIYVFIEQANKHAKCLILDHDGIGIFPNIDWNFSGSGEDYLIPEKSIVNSDGNLVVLHNEKYTDGIGYTHPVNEISIWSITGTFISKQSVTTENHKYESIFQDLNTDYWLCDTFRKQLEYYWFDGSFNLGATYYSFDYISGTPTDYDFTNIKGIAFIGNKLFVADNTNECVYIFDSSLTYISQFAVAGIDGICEDKLNNRIVCSCDTRVDVYDTSGNLVLSFDGGVGDGDMTDNWYIACSPVTGKFYLTQYGSDYVYIYDIDGTYLSRFGGTGTGNGQFNTPYGLDIDDEDNIYVADGVDNDDGRVQKFQPDGTYILTFADFSMEYPIDVVCGNNGNIYVVGSGLGTDGYMPIYDKNGNFIMSWGMGVTGYGYGYFYFPSYGAFVDAESDTLYSVAGGNNTEIQFNDNGALGGDSDFTYDKATKKMTLNGELKHTGNTAGLYAVTPVIQNPSIANATDLTSAISQLNALLQANRNIGIIAMYDMNWAELRPAGDIDKKWRTIACDDDASFIIVAEDGGRIWFTSNGGTNWTETRPAGDVDRKWVSVACDADGSNVIVCCYSADSYGTGRVFTSSDGCANWTERRPNGFDNDFYWTCVASDNDGSVLIAACYSGASADDGQIWLSINSGANWTKMTPAGAVKRNWKSVACNSDGSVIIAGIISSSNGRIFMTVDTGANWTETRPAGDVNKEWRRVDCNSDGSILLAMENYGRVRKSIDGGANWTEIRPNGNSDWLWNYSVISTDGNIIIVMGWFNANGIFVSKDGGVTWTDNGFALGIDWWGVDISGDCAKAVVCSFSTSPSPITGRVYIGDL